MIPAEADVIAYDRIPKVNLTEMRQMGLFRITIPEEYGRAGMSISQYIETVKHGITIGSPDKKMGQAGAHITV